MPMSVRAAFAVFVILCIIAAIAWFLHDADDQIEYPPKQPVSPDPDDGPGFTQ